MVITERRTKRPSHRGGGSGTDLGVGRTGGKPLERDLMEILREGSSPEKIAEKRKTLEVAAKERADVESYIRALTGEGLLKGKRTVRPFRRTRWTFT